MIRYLVSSLLFKAAAKALSKIMKSEIVNCRGVYLQARERRLAVKNAVKDGFELRQIIHARYADFGFLSDAGYEVRKIEDRVTSIKLRGVAPLEIPKQWDEREWMKPMPIIKPKISKLHRATLFPDGTALLPDGIYCMAEPDFYRRRKLKTYPPPPRPGRALRHIFRETDDVLLIAPKNLIPVPGRCFSAQNMHSHNFAHFVHDTLTRIYYEDLGELVPGRDKVISPIFCFPMQKALFDKVFAKYEIVRSSADTAFEVEELLLPESLHCRGAFNPGGISALAKRMPQIMAPYTESDKLKVCVSRGDGKKDARRRFINEKAYEKRMRELGYRNVEVSALSPNSQFALWANAKDIVGIHGAGMVNMIMMSPGNYTEIADLIGVPTLARSAISAGHRVSVIPSIFDLQGQSMIDLDRLEARLRENS